MNIVHVIRLAFEGFGYIAFGAVLLVWAFIKLSSALEKAWAEDRF